MDVDAPAHAARVCMRGKRSQDLLEKVGLRNCIVVNIGNDERPCRVRSSVSRLRKTAMRTVQTANIGPLLDDRSSIVGRSVVHNDDFVFTGIQRLRLRGLQTTRQYVSPVVSANNQRDARR